MYVIIHGSSPLLPPLLNRPNVVRRDDIRVISCLTETLQFDSCNGVNNIYILSNTCILFFDAIFSARFSKQEHAHVETPPLH